MTKANSQDAANSAAQTASQLASSTAAAVGLTAHSHAQEHQHSTTLPGDATCGAVTKMDSEGLAVFEDPGVRHEILVKINKLAMFVRPLPPPPPLSLFPPLLGFSSPPWALTCPPPLPNLLKSYLIDLS